MQQLYKYATITKINTKINNYSVFAKHHQSDPGSEVAWWAGVGAERDGGAGVLPRQGVRVQTHLQVSE